MSHTTDWEKPGIEPATPGLHDIGLSTTPWPVCTFFVAVFLVYNQCWPGGFCGVLCPGTPEGSTALVPVLKRLRRRDEGLKSHPTDWQTRKAANHKSISKICMPNFVCILTNKITC